MESVPAFGWRFLRQLRSDPEPKSYAWPSGLTANTIHTSVRFTMFVIRVSLP
jgi:hypothetical protein